MGEHRSPLWCAWEAVYRRLECIQGEVISNAVVNLFFEPYIMCKINLKRVCKYILINIILKDRIDNNKPKGKLYKGRRG